MQLGWFKGVPECKCIATCKKICSTCKGWWLTGENKRLLSLQPRDFVLCLNLSWGGKFPAHPRITLLKWEPHAFWANQLQPWLTPEPGFILSLVSTLSDLPCKSTITSNHGFTPVDTSNTLMWRMNLFHICPYIPHCLANKASCNTKYTPGWCSTYYLSGEKTSQTVK